ncbi:hypothetical protein [Aeromonas sp. QDB30]|uniref:hypothetical protein n=1 Tax=Aeromonas sp. QDB30 TaxID=2989831 RepID=UPI0022E1BFCE|nr:hypothetical protein [Aeromonas sp. QDB30]
MKRYDLELTATGPVMEERKEGAFVPFSEVSGLADTVMKMGDRCQLLADLLREVTQIVPAIGVAIDDLPAVDAFLERIEAALAGQALERIGSNALAMMMDELHDICVGLDAPGGAQNGAEAWDQVKGARDRVLAGLHQDRPDTEWTDATTSPVAADYRELQEQNDQLQSRLKGALDLLHELREGAEIHLHNCKICKNEEGVNNWTGKLQRIDALLAGHVPEPVYYMRDNHTFKRLSDDVDTAITEIEAELDAGWTSGMLCSKRKGFSSLHANYRRPREEFIADCRDALLAAAPKPEGGEPCAIEPPSSSPA